MKKLFKNLLWMFIISSAFFVSYGVFAAGGDSDLEVDWFNILPELEESEVKNVSQKISEIWQTWWSVWDNYNKAASSLTTSEQVASWIMNRDTIMNYLVFIVQFMSQLWLVVWTLFIMYAWYEYMLSVFKWWKLPTETVKNAIIWVIIVIFSYAILKTLTSLIGIS